MKKILAIITLAMASLAAQAAQVDLGFGTGKVTSSSVALGNASVELGVFSGYTDTAGLGWFSGKNYSTLRTSWTSFAEITSPSITNTDTGAGAGLFYGSYDLGSTTINTRLFAWVQNTQAPSSSSTAWAVISGTIGATDIFNQVWVAPSPTAQEINIIEAGLTSSVLFAGVNAYIVPSTFVDPNGANLNFQLAAVPEPSIASLLALGTVGLVALRARRKS